MEYKYPDVYLISMFPGIANELKKYLPKECNLVIVPPIDTVKIWDKDTPLTKDSMSLNHDAEILIVDCTYVSEILYKLPNAKWVQTTRAGFELLMDKIDKNKTPNFMLTRYVDPRVGELMSNYVIAQIVNLERGFYSYYDKQKTAEWSHPFFPDCRVLSDLTIGVLGAGNLGTAVGGLLKKGKARVVAYVRNASTSCSEGYNEATTDLTYVLEHCEYLINVLPSTEETKGLLNPDALKSCKKKPVFINIGRGDIIEDNNIIKSFEVYITPHVAAIPRISGIAQVIAQNYVKYVKGEPLLNVVDWKKGY